MYANSITPSFSLLTLSEDKDNKEENKTTVRFNYEIKNDVTATITVNRKDLNRMSLGQVKFAELLSTQAMKIDGSQQDFIAFFSKVDNFEFWFNIVEP